MSGRRILFIGEFTGFAGGIERYAWRTARLLRKNDFQVDWCGRTPARDEALFRGGFDRSLAPGELLAGPMDYDLAALHKLPELSFLHALRRRFGERLIFWAHDHDLYCPRRHYYTPFGRVNCHRAYAPLRCALCARITSPRNWKYLRAGHTALLEELRGHHAVVLSHFMRGNLLRNGFSPANIRLIPPVIETAEPGECVSAGPGPLKILFLGQLIRGKGADLLLDALERLGVPWQAQFAGEGGDRALLEARAESSPLLRGRVVFSRWLTDPESALGSCDVVVFPSRWQEPFGLAGAEGSACGRPVVAFDVGGVREWLVDGVTGFAVPEKDTAAMAEKLELLQRDHDLRLKLGGAGRKFVAEHFSQERFLLLWNDLMKQVSP
ncbi:MAG: glycosyltransferase family 4 protein [Lentisphaeria bacterium]|nr:glycosyltransferase family 4 protein [Lentisphaeria bacterium]